MATPELKKCPNCGLMMYKMTLFTSHYWACPRCNPQDLPEKLRIKPTENVINNDGSIEIPWEQLADEAQNDYIGD